MGKPGWLRSIGETFRVATSGFELPGKRKVGRVSEPVPVERGDGDGTDQDVVDWIKSLDAEETEGKIRLGAERSQANGSVGEIEGVRFPRALFSPDRLRKEPDVQTRFESAKFSLFWGGAELRDRVAGKAIDAFERRHGGKGGRKGRVRYDDLSGEEQQEVVEYWMEQLKRNENRPRRPSINSSTKK